MAIQNSKTHADLVDKVCLANGYLAGIATLNDAIILAASNNACLDTTRELADISNVQVGLGISDIDLASELEKLQGASV